MIHLQNNLKFKKLNENKIIEQIQKKTYHKSDLNAMINCLTVNVFLCL